jgi:hypothetical protein
MLRRTLLVSLLSMLVLLASVSFASMLHTALPGTDQWRTQTGSYFNFGTQPGAPFAPVHHIGVVQFVGLPIYPNGADTLIARLTDADINGSPIPIQLLALSWQSVGLVDVDGVLYSVTATLDPAHLAEDIGTMSIMGSNLGGTYDAQLTAFILFHFANPDPPFDLDIKIRLDTTIIPPWTGQPSNIPGEVYFDPSVTVYNLDDGMGQVILDPVPTPEPGTLVLLSSAALAVLGRMKAQRR